MGGDEDNLPGGFAAAEQGVVGWDPDWPGRQRKWLFQKTQGGVSRAW